MNSLVLRKVALQPRLLYQVRNSGGYWNKDWMPGPYPVTPEQKAAAAKKYNLVPEEYEPYPMGDGMNERGDYPKLPEISTENKDIYYPWDLPDDRRNFGEPMHHHAIFYTEDRVDTHARQKFKYSPLVMFLCLATFVGTFFSTKLMEKLRFYPPIAARHMPTSGVTHYTYEKE